MSRPAAHVDAMRAGKEFFLAQVAGLDDAGLGEPFLLPGWSRRHVIAHVARNADALRNFLAWARTGIETPTYASPAERDHGETTASRPGRDAGKERPERHSALPTLRAGFCVSS